MPQWHHRCACTAASGCHLDRRPPVHDPRNDVRGSVLSARCPAAPAPGRRVKLHQAGDAVGEQGRAIDLVEWPRSGDRLIGGRRLGAGDPVATGLVAMRRCAATSSCTRSWCAGDPMGCSRVARPSCRANASTRRSVTTTRPDGPSRTITESNSSRYSTRWSCSRRTASDDDGVPGWSRSQLSA